MTFDEAAHPRKKNGMFAQKQGTAPNDFLLGAYGTAEDARNFRELEYIHQRDIDIYDDPQWKADVQKATVENGQRLLREGVVMSPAEREFATRVERADKPQPADIISERFPTAEVVNVRLYDNGRREVTAITDGNDKVLWGRRGEDLPGLQEAVDRLPREAFVKVQRQADYRPQNKNPDTDADLCYFELSPAPVILKEFPAATTIHAVAQGDTLVLDYAETDDDSDESFYNFSPEADAAVAASWTMENPGEWEPWDDDESRWVRRIVPFSDVTDSWSPADQESIDILDNDMDN